MDEIRIVGVVEAAKIIGVSHFAACELIASREFPPALQVLEPATPIWLAETIEEYARTREERRPPPITLDEFKRRNEHRYGMVPWLRGP
jgi:hypothetical protein